MKSFLILVVTGPIRADSRSAAGPKGWNAQQGFYIYRKERLIVAGDWINLGYKQEEHYKLARILVDIPNNMDKEWKIDVKKAIADPPDSLRKKFKRIAKLTRGYAASVYRYRGKIELRKHDKINRFVWLKKKNRGIVTYKVDKQHPINICSFLFIIFLFRNGYKFGI